jgi:hypothetical protein
MYRRIYKGLIACDIVRSSVTQSHKEKLGNLQQEIIKHIFECREIETVSHLARSLKRKQPTIFKSVQLLHKLNYLESKLDTRYYTLGGKERQIGVTEKGAAAAITLGVPFNRIEIYHQNYRRFTFLNAENLYYIWEIINPYNKRQVIVEKAMHYALENNYFDKGKFRYLNRDESEKLKLLIALECIKSSIGEVSTLKAFIDKYGLDKTFLKKYLTKQKQYLDSLIKSLD